MLHLALFFMTSALAGTVSLDQATVSELAAIEGVDTSVAESIVTLRQQRGGHVSNHEALRVLPGMSEQTLQVLRENTTVELPITNEQKKPTTVDEVMAYYDHEPSVQEVQDWASWYARTHPELIQQWVTASKTAALLPELQVRYYLDDKWGQDFNYYYEDSNYSGTPADYLDQADVSQGWRFQVQGKWRLDELVISSEQIRVINEAQDAVKIRDKLLADVTRIYFERRRAQVDALLQPKSGLQSQVKEQLRLMELTANLDALTGGRFSEALGPN